MFTENKDNKVARVRALWYAPAHKAINLTFIARSTFFVCRRPGQYSMPRSHSLSLTNTARDLFKVYDALVLRDSKYFSVYKITCYRKKKEYENILDRLINYYLIVCIGKKTDPFKSVVKQKKPFI